MMSLALGKKATSILVIVLTAVALIYGYYSVGEQYPLLDFGMTFVYDAKSFYKWLIVTTIILLLLMCLLKKEDIIIYEQPFNKRTLYIIQLLFLVFLFFERSTIYHFWEPLRIDFEQHMWVAIGRNLNDFWLGLKPTRNPYSIWAGQYNGIYGYFIAVASFIAPIRSWFSYVMLSVAVTGIAACILTPVINRVFGKTAVIFFITSVLFSAYFNFASFYMKHHIIILFFYAVLMYCIFKYWKKPSVTNVAILSTACFIAFISYIGCIYFLPIAVMAVLLTSGSMMRKLSATLIVALPTGGFLLYLLLFPERWPSAYFLKKAIWHHPYGLTYLQSNVVAELKFLFIPGSIWGWLMQACFIVGLVYIVKSRKKETWIWLIGLGSCLAAMLTSWDREMGHNFIMILPYVVIASFGAAQLWNNHFNFSFLTKSVYALVFLVGFTVDFRDFALSEKWLKYNVFDLSTPMDKRLWFFDDARKLQPFSGRSIVIDANLINTVLESGYARYDSDIISEFGYALHFSDFLIYKESVFLHKEDTIPNVCDGVFLTDKALDETQSLMGKDAEVKLLDKYRPKNPRYDRLKYQPDVFHYLYNVKFEGKCLSNDELHRVKSNYCWGTGEKC